MMTPTPSEHPVVGLSTLQFHVGDLFDAKPVDGYRVHLVRETKMGTPGPTLCGIDRFHPQSAGWSVRGGVSGPGIEHLPCEGCAATRAADFPELPVRGLGREAHPAAASAVASHTEGRRWSTQCSETAR